MSLDGKFVEQVKRYLQIKKEENQKEKKLRRFGYALESLDAERINELLQDGVAIADYEKIESVLSRVLEGYSSYLFNTLDDYRRKVLRKKDGEFYRDYWELNAEDLPDALRDLIEPLNKTVIALLEYLYQNGANINHDTYLGYSDSGFLSDKKEVKKGASVMAHIMDCYYFSKQMDLVDWILAKSELNLEPKMIKSVLYQKNHDSAVLLDRLLDRGFKDEGYNFLTVMQAVAGMVGGEDLMDKDNEGFQVTPLVECIAHKDLEYRQEKFSVLWHHASELEKRQIKENWNLDDLEIPVDNLGEEDPGLDGDSTAIRL